MVTQRIYWITGASSGIGEALAIYLAKEGHLVAVSARSADKLKQLAQGDYGAGRIVAYPVDILDPAALSDVIGRMKSELGGIDAAILNAGTYVPDEPGQIDIDGIEKQFQLNVFAAMRSLAAVLPVLRRDRRPQIALMASVAGYRGLPRAAGYGGSKAAVLNMAESLKFGCDAQGIKLQVISPGFVKTPLTDKNPFPMPFLITAEQAAIHIARGLDSKRFEIVFPFGAALSMKLLQLLPYGLFFRLVAKATGVKPRP